MLPVNAPIVDDAALLVVVMRDRAGGIDAGLQVIRRQRGIQLVEGRDLARGSAERDVRCRAAAGGSDLQGLTGDRGGSDVGRSSAQAERGERVARPGADDQVLGRTRAEHELAGTIDDRGRGGAGDAVDRAKDGLHGRRAARTNADGDVAAAVGRRRGLRGAEGDVLAIDRQNRSGGDGGREVVGGGARGADQLGRSRDINRRCVVILDGRAGDGGVGPGSRADCSPWRR